MADPTDPPEPDPASRSQSPNTRKSARTRKGREFFSPELGGGMGSTRWSPEMAKRVPGTGMSPDRSKGKQRQEDKEGRSPSFELIDPVGKGEGSTSNPGSRGSPRVPMAARVHRDSVGRGEGSSTIGSSHRVLQNGTTSADDSAALPPLQTNARQSSSAGSSTAPIQPAPSVSSQSHPQSQPQTSAPTLPAQSAQQTAPNPVPAPAPAIPTQSTPTAPPTPIPAQTGLSRPHQHSHLPPKIRIEAARKPVLYDLSSRSRQRNAASDPVPQHVPGPITQRVPTPNANASPIPNGTQKSTLTSSPVPNQSFNPTQPRSRASAVASSVADRGLDGMDVRGGRTEVRVGPSRYQNQNRDHDHNPEVPSSKARRDPPPPSPPSPPSSSRRITLKPVSKPYDPPPPAPASPIKKKKEIPPREHERASHTGRVHRGEEKSVPGRRDSGLERIPSPSDQFTRPSNRVPARRLPSQSEEVTQSSRTGPSRTGASTTKVPTSVDLTRDPPMPTVLTPTSTRRQPSQSTSTRDQAPESSSGRGERTEGEGRPSPSSHFQDFLRRSQVRGGGRASTAAAKMRGIVAAGAASSRMENGGEAVPRRDKREMVSVKSAGKESAESSGKESIRDAGTGNGKQMDPEPMDVVRTLSGRLSRPSARRLPPPLPTTATPTPALTTESTHHPRVAVPLPPPPPSQETTKATRLAAKQAEIAQLIDAHDTVLREMFHLEKFKTMVVGYDPWEAKRETSNVWKEWQAPYDLINKFITSVSVPSEQDGEESGSRRTTRRAMAKKVNDLPLEVLLGIPPSLRIVKEEPKVVEMEVNEEEGGGREKETSLQREVRMEVEELPVPRPSRLKSVESGKRKSAPITLDTPTPTTLSFTPPPAQPRPSKKRRVATPSDLAVDFQIDFEVPQPPVRARLVPAQEYKKSVRSRPRPVKVYKLPPAPPPRYTCPEQFPAHRPPAVPASHIIFASPKLTAFPKTCDVVSAFPSEVLTSFVMLEAEGECLDQDELRKMARERVDILRKFVELQMRGRIRQGEEVTRHVETTRSIQPTSHRGVILDHALRYRSGMQREQKLKSNLMKKLVKAVNGYWTGVASRDERRAKEEERRRRVGARDVAKAVKNKWKLAANVIRMRKQAEARAEQERLGREHLKKILERSEDMIKNRGRTGTRVKEKRKREVSEEFLSSRPQRYSPVQPVYDIYDLMAEDEQGHVHTDEEVPADLDIEEEQAAKAYEIAVLDTPDKSIVLESPGVPNEDAFFIEVPELAVAEKRTYSRQDLLEDIDLPFQHLPTSSETVPASQDLEVNAKAASPSAMIPVAAPVQIDSLSAHTSLDRELPENEFNLAATEDIDAEDRLFDEEMLAEDAQVVDSDNEDEGLLRDAELPIEELLARYGYKLDQDPAVPMQVDLDDTPTIVDTSMVDQEDSGDSDDECDRRNIDESVGAASTPSDDMEAESDADTDADQPTALPFLLRATLRPYQKDGLTWLARLYREKTNAILADEMGLGKTLQTIALLAHLACDQQEWGPHLIIVPTSVILNWEMEFKKFLPGFKVLTYYGNQQERKERRKGWFAPHAFQVCITSYQIAIADQAIFRRRHWQYLILDEAHNIKNFRSQRWQTLLGFKSERRLLLTGTPLQNNLMELWSLMYFLMPSGLSDDPLEGGEFANHKNFSEWFANPMDKAVESGDGISPEARETVNRLHVILRPFILRRLKADVEKQLPAKVEHTVYCNLSKRQQYLYDEFMSRSSTRRSLVSGGYLGIANCLMQLRKVCNHPDLFEVRPIETSYAMKESVVSSFLGSVAAVQGTLRDASDAFRPDVLPIHQDSGISTSIASRAANRLDASSLLPFADETKCASVREPPKDTRTVEGWRRYRAYHKEVATRERWHRIRDSNREKCNARPIISVDMLGAVHVPLKYPESRLLAGIIPSHGDRLARALPALQQFAVTPPKVTALEPKHIFPEEIQHLLLEEPFHHAADILHPTAVKLQIAFPDKTLLQYDCGKLQMLAEMLKNLQAGGHRVLIFTQMTKMLDILETFLSHSGYRYSRLDGSTKVEDRLLITERFNNNPRIFAFIASTRSGGVGINLTGADTVIFYDNEFNPAMDKQAMDRAHRIGQTREVHIYRLVTRHTVEENMLKKANQKRLLDDVVMQEGNFTTDYLTGSVSKGKSDLRDMLGDDVYDSLEAERQHRQLGSASPSQEIRSRAGSVATVDEREIQNALEQVQDTEDIDAAREAAKEIELDDTDFIAEFDKNGTQDRAGPDQSEKESLRNSRSASATAVSRRKAHHDSGETMNEHDLDNHDYDNGLDDEQVQQVSDDDSMDGDTGAIDEYMLRIVEWDWNYFV